MSGGANSAHWLRSGPAACPAAESWGLKWGREPPSDGRDWLVPVERSRPVVPRCGRPDPQNSLRGEAEVRLGSARSPEERCDPAVPGGGDTGLAFRPTEGRGSEDWGAQRGPPNETTPGGARKIKKFKKKKKKRGITKKE
ncbi:hypothetical protein NDU88_011788 [Pleurodeles waltl]|uniref:Uncharacterized protein n=1 Tax=Pleurodeles waltl TaxID=8319 RepID=A0AAV7R1E4_PLEWA|nr:hypothetical protein NDU88_011788 [Pleurodeles waltl]